jgi:putative ABC transport system permease protein
MRAAWAWVRRLGRSLTGMGRDRDLDDELRFHLEMQTALEVGRGTPPADAERAARLRLGATDVISEAYRDQQGVRGVDTILQDVRYAARALRRDSRFAVVGILTLTVGIGAVTTIFSLVRGVLLDPLPYPQPDRLVRVYESNPQFPLFPVGPYGLLAYRHENRTLSGFAGYTREDLQLATDNRPERLRGLQVSSNYFQVLGILPARGRAFTWTEERKDADVAVLSDAVWQSRFRGDPGVVGRAVRLSGRLFTIVGVMPPGFQHVGGTYRSPAQGETVDVWWPLPLERASERKGWHYINAIARLKAGVTAAQAQADLAAVSTRIRSADDRWDVRAVPLLADVVGRSSDAIRLLTIAVGLLMLIACANVSSLLLARATARRRERAVRFALGASRWRLLRQSLVESLVLSAPGALGGALVTIAGVGLLVAVLPEDFPRLHNVRVDWTVLGFAVVLTGASVLVFGLLPAWQQASDDVHPMLHDTNARTSASGRTVRLRNVLVVSEIALASALLICAGLLARSFVALGRAPAGFNAQKVMTALVALPQVRYPEPEDASRFVERLMADLRTVAGVRSAGAGSDVPWTGYDENTSFEIVGRRLRDEPSARFHVATPGYFETLGIPLIAGRHVDARDRAGSPLVIVINQALALKYFPGENPLGRALDVWGRQRTIVGVVGDVKDAPTDAAAVPAFWWPHAQQPFPGVMVVVASDQDPATLVPALRQVVGRLDPELPLAEVRSMNEIAAAANAQRRFVLAMTALFAVAALLLAAVGAYGVLAWTVRQRTRELGVRVALGARRRDVLLLVLRHGGQLASAGIFVGAVAALASGRVLQALLYGVSPRDAATFAAAASAMLVIACLAALGPAWAATRADPVEALRLE